MNMDNISVEKLMSSTEYFFLPTYFTLIFTQNDAHRYNLHKFVYRFFHRNAKFHFKAYQVKYF